MNENEYESLQREYSRLASRYDIRWKFYVEVSIRETLRRLHVAPEDHVLDIGCGTGAFLESLALASPRVQLTGVDLSRDMLEIARRRLGAAADLKQAHAETLPFGEAVFDIEVSTNAFHFIRRPVAALQEISRVLKPSGRIVITDWCDDYLTCRVCDMFLRVFSRAHFRTYGSKECHGLLVEAGFAGINIERYKINWLWGLMTATATKDVAQQPHAAAGTQTFPQERVFLQRR